MNKNVYRTHSELDEGIVILTLARVEKLNSLNNELLEELLNEIKELEKFAGLKALIITSATTKAFSTGIDVKFVKGIDNNTVAEFFYQLANLLDKVTKLSVPTIAAVNGYAFGAGADLALACDLRIANNKAKFRFPGSQFGVVLGTERLIMEVGVSTARTLTLMNKLMDSKEAHQFAIVHEILDEENCVKRAEQLAKQIIYMPNYAQSTIRKMCRKETDDYIEKDPCVLAKDSILAVNFKETFERYLKRIGK